jgi:phosphoserine phosphatase RsbU/P
MAREITMNEIDIPTLLIVDDSLINITIYRTLLEKKGYKIFTAGSVSEASLILGSEKIDYIILDYYLSGINTGTELIKKLKKYNFSVTIYASSATEENNHELIEAGCDDIIRPEAVEIDRLFNEVK